MAEQLSELGRTVKVMKTEFETKVITLVQAQSWENKIAADLVRAQNTIRVEVARQQELAAAAAQDDANFAQIQTALVVASRNLT
jgi:hypothetical protein